MNATELQDALQATIELLDKACDEIDGNDNDATLARLVRDMTANLDSRLQAVSFNKARVMTRNAGLVLSFANGAEFELTIKNR